MVGQVGNDGSEVTVQGLWRMDQENKEQELTKSALKKLAKEKEKEARKAQVAARLAAEKAAREAASVDVAVGKYGKLPMNQSAERSGNECTFNFR